MNAIRGKVIGLPAVLALVVLLLGSGCTSGAKKGAAIGGVVGAATGAIIGNQGDKTGTGAIVGGALGATTGAIIGDYMSRQKQELEQVPGAQVTQEGDELRVAFQSAILFDTDRYELKSGAKDNLSQLAGVLQKYAQTNLIIVGHTDDTGSEAYNQRLSEQRADAVRDHIVHGGVGSERLQARGMGETRPVASNETADGRTQNRRVEIQIAANEDLKKKAAAQGN
jgi:outer membrane protein OmpA-like peptidoglycan-associated protein